MSESDQYISNVINNINPKKKYSEIDLLQLKDDLSKHLCTQCVIDFVESKVKPIEIDAFELSRKIEDVWRECLMQNVASGIYSSKDIKTIAVYIKNELGEFIPVKGAYNHNGIGVILEM